MSFLKNRKAHKPVAGLEGYFMAMLGKSKYGKTTFAYDLVKEYFGDLSKAILLAPEIGYKALNGVHALPIGDFDKTSDEQKKEQDLYGFIETVDDLIENKSEIPYRAVIIDTITALEDLAIKYTLKTESRKKGKRFNAINDIPFGNGYNMVAENIYSQIDRLKKAGFFVLVIGHEKTKQIENRDGSTYNLITLNALGKTIDIIEREADMIIYGDLVTEVNDGEVTQKRYLRFRSDGNIICGSRFRTMPDSIELDVKLFLKTFKEAVIASYDGDEKAVEKAVVEQSKEREKKAEAYIETQLNKDTPESLIAKIDESIKSMSKEQQDELKAQLKQNYKTMNYKKYTEQADLDGALLLCQSILAE